MWRAFWKSGRSQCSRTRDALSGYLDRRLNPEEAARVEEHISTCQECREEMESLRATVALLQSLPEVTPSRSFALAAVKPLPGRMVWPALRFATAAAVLLLVAAIAVDGTGALEQRGPSASYSYYVPAQAHEADDAGYWLIQGERSDIADAENVTRTAVNLVVPDGSDNVYTAAYLLEAKRLAYGTIEPGVGGVPQLVLKESEEAVSGQGDVVEFSVVATPEETTSPFAPSCPAETSVLDEIVSRQVGEFLNMVPANSDNTVLYTFNLSDSVPAKTLTVPVDESGTTGSGAAFGTGDEPRWLRPLEFGLIGLVVALAGGTAALWMRRRRVRVTNVSDNGN